MIENQYKKRVVISTALGGGLELFDFVIYLFLSPLIARLFFPGQTVEHAFLLTLAGFAIGYLARPLGGIVYGHFGDINGRLTALSSAIFLMAAPTFLMAIMPTYHEMGIAAPIILIILRFVQGLAMGGDMPGAICFIGEHIELSRRGQMTNWLVFGVNIGAVLAGVLISFLTSVLSDQRMLSWGWRIPFLFGAILAIVGFYLRKKMSETPAFLSCKAQAQTKRWPLKFLLTEHLYSTLTGFLVTALAAMVTAILSLFMSSYMSSFVGIKTNLALWLNSGSIALYSCFCPIIGLCIDKWSAWAVLRVGIVALMLFVYPIYVLINSQHLIHSIVGLGLSAPILAAIMGSLPSVLLKLLPVEVRYSGIGVSYNLGFCLFGGTAPLLMSYLIHKFDSILMPAYFLVIVAIVAFTLMLIVQSRHGKGSVGYNDIFCFSGSKKLRS